MKVVRDHPILTAVIVLLLVVIPGFIRIEMLARDTAAVSEDRCRVSNDSRAEIRNTFHEAFEQLVTIGADAAFVQQLHDIVPTPDEQDIDCTGDEQLTEADYSA